MSTSDHSIVLPLDQVRIDGGTQSRAVLDSATIQEYAEQIKAGVSFPPIHLVYDGSSYWLVDGFHRREAYLLVGLVLVPCVVFQGTQRDAVLISVGVNFEHGLRRTPADKRIAVLRLLNDSEWVNWSDNEISRRCSVSVPFVGKLRAELSQENNQLSLPVADRVYIRNGKQAVMKTGNIGGAGKQSAQPETQPAALPETQSETLPEILPAAVPAAVPAAGFSELESIEDAQRGHIAYLEAQLQRSRDAYSELSRDFVSAVESYRSRSDDFSSVFNSQKSALLDLQSVVESQKSRIAELESLVESQRPDNVSIHLLEIQLSDAQLTIKSGIEWQEEAELQIVNLRSDLADLRLYLNERAAEIKEKDSLIERLQSELSASRNSTPSPVNSDGNPQIAQLDKLKTDWENKLSPYLLKPHRERGQARMACLMLEQIQQIMGVI